jgi:sugar-specific transcriptional regulator TrmB
MILEIKERLREAGLTENEAKIYSVLLEQGTMSAGRLSKKTGLHRRVIYDALDRLIEKGLVGYILENNRRIFSASNPLRFLEIIKEKEDNVNSILPNMLELFNSEKEKEKDETLFFKGREGLKSVFEDEISSKDIKEILIISPFPSAYDVLPFYFKWHDKKRQEKKIKTRIIFQKLKEEKIKRIPLSEIRFLPKEFASPTAINIYGNKVAIILWSKKNPLAIVIKQEEIAQGYKNYFNLLWKIARKQ